MQLVTNSLLLIFSIALLWIGANYLVDSAEKIANTFRIPELIIGLTVVAFGTSAPEFAVTINASLTGQSSISVGNIVGSNIFNLGFILGGVALISTVTSSKKMVYRDGLFMLLTTLILLIFFRTDNYTLTRIEGCVLFLLLIGYLIFLFIKKEPLEDNIIHKKAALKDFFILPASLAVIVFGGNQLVSSASSIAKFFGLSDWLIAITVVAAGTSAPEMVTSLAAALKNKHELSAGNLIGSNIFNLLGVLGVAGLIRPLTIDPSAFQSLIMLVTLITLLIVFLRSGWKVSRIEGAILILMGIALWSFDFIRLSGAH